MKLILRSTDQIVQIIPEGPIGEVYEGLRKVAGKQPLEGRVWVGETGGGVKVQALILSVAVAHGESTVEFEVELKETPAPLPVHPAFPLRMIV